MYLTGRGVSPGLAIGNAFLYRDILYRDLEHYTIDKYEVEEEYSRIERAIEEVLSDLGIAVTRVEKELDSDLADIFRAHQTILRAPALAKEFKSELEQELVNAEHVVQSVFQKWIRRFDQANEESTVLRSEDLTDLSRRLLKAITGIHTHALEKMPAQSVLVARQLLPSDTVHLSRKSTVAVVVARGGPGSHAALLTRELGIPAVTQIGDQITNISNDETLLVDGSSGVLITNPDKETKSTFEKRIKQLRVKTTQARENCFDAALTRDGVHIQVMANIGCQEDAVMARDNGADGVGLYRIECIYLSRKNPPSEEELYQETNRALLPFKDSPVTVRLLDVGGDKQLPFLHFPSEADPALGMRGVRVLLKYPDLLDIQLRTFLRLSKKYQISIMIPMVTTGEEVEQVSIRLKKSADAMKLDSIPPLGVMIETPAAALCVKDIAEYADFFSIGTNDLTQYVMAAGRENPLVCDYFQDDHPAIFKLIHLANKQLTDKPIGVCGELAGQESALVRLLESGIRKLSVAPGRVSIIKQAIRGLSCYQNSEKVQVT